MRFSKSDLDGQFVLTQQEKFIPAKWNLKEKNSWILASHPSLPVIDILASNRDHLGWLLGYPITSEGELYPKEFIIPIESGKKLDDQIIESNLYTFGGRFIGIFLVYGFYRLYLDACGSLAAVFSEKEPIVASTPSLIGYEWDEEVIKAIGMPESCLWIPSGLTSQKSVTRLLPNHYLDLSSLKTVRHWPKNTKFSATDTKETVENIIRRLRILIAAVAEKHLLHLSLTAGRDTRILLACAKEQLDKILFFTFSHEKETVDEHIARLVVERFNLNHKIIPVEYATYDQLKSWLYRTGYCVSEGIWKTHITTRHYDYYRALLPGMAGEVGRSFYWRQFDTQTKQLDAKQLLSRFHLPSSGKILLQTENWLSELRGLNTFLILDLMYIELRLGCWAGPAEYGGGNKSICKLYLFSHREIFTSMLSLPFEYRMNQFMADDICKIAWPELLDFPYNEFTGVKKYTKKINIYAKKIHNRLNEIKYRILFKYNNITMSSNMKKWYF